MGRKRSPGLEWLEPENTNQRQWALEYLRARGLDALFRYSEAILPGELPSHAVMLGIGKILEDGEHNPEVLRRMKEAWRKKRSVDKATDRQVCAFTLSKSTKAHLKELANARKTDATALLEKLVENAYKSYLREVQKQQIKPQPLTLLADRKYGLHELKDQLRPSEETAAASQQHPQTTADFQADNSSAHESVELKPLKVLKISPQSKPPVLPASPTTPVTLERHQNDGSIESMSAWPDSKPPVEHRTQDLNHIEIWQAPKKIKLQQRKSSLSRHRHSIAPDGPEARPPAESLSSTSGSTENGISHTGRNSGTLAHAHQTAENAVEE